MAMANDLIVLFLGLEILSIALYVLAGYAPPPGRVAGGGPQVLRARRLLLGLPPLRHRPGLRRHRHRPTSPSIAIFLQRQRRHRRRACCSAGLALLLVGLGFKIAAVPFHVWTPDVYQGAPSPVTGFMAVGAKAAGFAGCCGCSSPPSARYALDWQPVRLGPRRAHAGGRLGPRHRADRRQAHAGLLLDQPRRLHPDRRAGRHRPGRRGRALLPARLHVHGGWAASGWSPGRPARATPPRPRRLPGPGRSRPGAGPRLHGVPAGPGRACPSRRASWPSSTSSAAAVDAGSPTARHHRHARRP